MWADNETSTDLLGFDVLVDELVVALTNAELHPLTVGVLGSWGSGKSSLLAIARKELELDAKFACVAFSPWQYEDVEDVKTALMTAVLRKCHDLAPDDDTKKLARRLLEKLPRFGRRASLWVVKSAPAVVPVALSALDPSMGAEVVTASQSAVQSASSIVEGALADRPGNDTETANARGRDPESLEQFRTEFKSLVDKLPVEAVVIFIDDLDRCMPPTVVDIFEALRLFLQTPKTAHVVAISRDVVEAAINSRYPGFSRQNGTGIGHEYLEKMLQLQFRIPDLSSVEIETYMNLLLTQTHLDKERFGKLVDDMCEKRRGVAFPPAYNAGLAATLLGDDLPEGLADDLAWVADICDVAASGLRGNPREVKRFLNDLTVRTRAAKRRGLILEPGVLAKLMVLDDQFPDDFQRVFDWQYQSAGISAELRLAEEFATGRRALPPLVAAAKEPARKGTGKSSASPSAEILGSVEKGAPAAMGPDHEAGASPTEDGAQPLDAAMEAMVSHWVSRPRIAKWLRMHPPLGDVDLGPYFSYFRDRILIGSSASALAPALQGLLGRILHEESSVARRRAIDEIEKLGEADQDALLEALLDAARRTPSGNAFKALAEVGGRVKRLGPAVCESLQTISHQLLNPLLILPAIAQLKDADGIDALVGAWKASSVPGIARVAAAGQVQR